MTVSARGEPLLLELLDGFLQTKVLITAYQLDLFTMVARAPRSPAELRAALGWPERSTTILVDACVALGLLELEGEALRVPDELAPFLVRTPDRPFRTTTYLLDYYAEVYRALDDMAELVRSDGASSSFGLRDYFKDDVAQVEAEVAREYSRYMDQTIAPIAKVVLETYDFGQHRSLLDLCGGTGTFCAAIVEATPGLRGAFLDVPACVELGRQQLAQRPAVAGRITPIAGDAFTTPLPEGLDVVTICRAAMDWGDERIEPLYRRVRQALPPGGRLVVVERMLPDRPCPEARSLYLRSVYFLAKSRSTRYRTPAGHVALLQRAGFSSVEVREPPRAPYAVFQSMKVVVARA
ncbi:methyltransferase [Paraliomyxa miuraensis]|uniref:methyltransferase n=1 Tax=Paraliomyxa miuraensis TaxID=376150 RepID=UPI002253EFC7|nr:methyltransferase [Paraliomyxa miuraensis]MCX4243102.1 acetylserotonin O-methyltransferase [Paraliomyxa miuraensis]